MFKNKGKKTELFWLLAGSKEDKYHYMVECLGVTSDAGGVDVLVLLTLTLLAHSHPHPFFRHRSMLLFLASILSFIWLTGSGNDPSSRAPLSATAALGPQVAVMGVLVLGLVFLAMIVKTLMRYGREWDEMRADVEMDLAAVSMQGGEPEERGQEMTERDRGRDGERSTRRRGGGADHHMKEVQ